MGHLSRIRIVARQAARASRTGLLALSLYAGMSFAQATPNEAAVEARTVALARILAEYHEDELKHEPELATPAGDTRYNDQLPDLSASAENVWLARGQTYIIRLSEIGTAGVPDMVRLPAERLLNTLLEEQESSHAKQWEAPLSQFTNLNTRLLALAAHLPFVTVKNYDDYIERLKKIPSAFSQIMTNLQLGVDQGRLPARAEADKVQVLVQAVAARQGDANPFAAPLSRFPVTISAADRKRIASDLLDTVNTSLVPAYQRLGRFVAAMPSPSGHIDAQGGARAVARP